MGSNSINRFGTMKDQGANLFNAGQPLDFGFMAENQDWEEEPPHHDGEWIDPQDWAPEMSAIEDSLDSDQEEDEFSVGDWDAPVYPERFPDYMELSAMRSDDNCDCMALQHSRNHNNREWVLNLSHGDHVRSLYRSHHTDAKRQCNKRLTIRRLV